MPLAMVVERVLEPIPAAYREGDANNVLADDRALSEHLCVLAPAHLWMFFYLWLNKPEFSFDGDSHFSPGEYVVACAQLKANC